MSEQKALIWDQRLAIWGTQIQGATKSCPTWELKSGSFKSKEGDLNYKEFSLELEAGSRVG